MMRNRMTQRAIRRSPGAAALVTGLLLLAACSDDDPADGESTPVLELGGEDGDAIGTCLLVTDELPAEVAELPVVPCELEHSHEIYYVEDDTRDVYPGLEALETFAQQVCVREFEPYVRISPFDSTLFFSWLVPTLDSWNSEQKDREVICVLGNLDGSLWTGTRKDSRI